MALNRTWTTMRDTARGSRTDGRQGRERAPGIVILGGERSAAPGPREPRIAAFIWGGKIRPAPTLPFGRWKGAA